MQHLATAQHGDLRRKISQPGIAKSGKPNMVQVQGTRYIHSKSGMSVQTMSRVGRRLGQSRHSLVSSYLQVLCLIVPTISRHCRGKNMSVQMCRELPLMTHRV